MTPDGGMTKPSPKAIDPYLPPAWYLSDNAQDDRPADLPCAVCGRPAGVWEWDEDDDPDYGGWAYENTWGRTEPCCSRSCYLTSAEFASHLEARP